MTPAAPGEHVGCAGRQTQPKGLTAPVALLQLEKQSQMSLSHRERPESLEGAFHSPGALRGGMSICKDSMDCSGSSWYRGSTEQMGALAGGYLQDWTTWCSFFSNLAMNGNNSLITTGFFVCLLVCLLVCFVQVPFTIWDRSSLLLQLWAGLFSVPWSCALLILVLPWKNESLQLPVPSTVSTMHNHPF